jgi:hypothetical protein
LELDLGSETLVARGRGNYSVLRKIMLYRTYMVGQGFENYSKLFKYKFRGFRVLTVMSNQRRIERLRAELTKKGFRKLVWFTDVNRMNKDTLLKKIWKISNSKDCNKYSILGG